MIGSPASTALRPKPPVAIADLTVVPKDVSATSKMSPALDRQTKALMSTWVRFGIGLLLVGAAVGGAVYNQRGSLLGAAVKAPQMTPAPASPAAVAQSASSQPQQAAVPAQIAPCAGTDSSDRRAVLCLSRAFYGVFALNKCTLSELDALSEQVPDKRVAMSTPVNKPSRTVLPDGRVKFIVFSPGIWQPTLPIGSIVRVVARVTRAMTFDAKGRGSFVPVTDAWNIRISGTNSG